jgi:hypothetical protein
MNVLILIIASLMMLTCRAKTDDFDKQHDIVKVPVPEADTLIVKKEVSNIISTPKFRKNIFFLVSNADTANHCYLISQQIQSGRIGMKYVPRRHLYVSYEQNDTLAVSESADDAKVFNPTVSEGAYIREFQLIIKSISNKYELSNLRSLELSMSTIDKLPEDIEEGYRKYYGENIKPNSNIKVSKIIQLSMMSQQISQILRPYNIDIDGVSIDGLIDYIPGSNRGEKMANKPKKIIKHRWDGLIIFKFKKIKN